MDSKHLMINICHTCKDIQKPARKCGGCGGAYYCSVECQRKDWPDHKISCKELKRVIGNRCRFISISVGNNRKFKSLLCALWWAKYSKCVGKNLDNKAGYIRCIVDPNGLFENEEPGLFKCMVSAEDFCEDTIKYRINGMGHAIINIPLPDEAVFLTTVSFSISAAKECYNRLLSITTHGALLDACSNRKVIVGSDEDGPTCDVLLGECLCVL